MNTSYEKIIERYFGKVWNQGKLEVLDEIIALDYINHSSSIPNPAPGPTGLKPIVTAMRLAFPDLHYEVHDLVVGEGKVAVRCTMTGTHTGDFFGIPATGQAVSVKAGLIIYTDGFTLLDNGVFFLRFLQKAASWLQLNQIKIPRKQPNVSRSFAGRCVGSRTNELYQGGTTPTPAEPSCTSNFFVHLPNWFISKPLCLVLCLF